MTALSKTSSTSRSKLQFDDRPWLTPEKRDSRKVAPTNVGDRRYLACLAILAAGCNKTPRRRRQLSRHPDGTLRQHDPPVGLRKYCAESERSYKYGNGTQPACRGRRVTICAGLQLHRSEKAPLLRRSCSALFGRKRKNGATSEKQCYIYCAAPSRARTRGLGCGSEPGPKNFRTPPAEKAWNWSVL